MNLETARSNLLEHSRSKRNGQFPAIVTHSGKLTNPLCGDHVQLQMQLEKDRIVEIGFSAQGCAICNASASMLSQEIKGLSADQAFKLSQEFEENVLAPADKSWPISLNSFSSFEHLKINPSRRACALLPWIALRSIFKEFTP